MDPSQVNASDVLEMIGYMNQDSAEVIAPQIYKMLPSEIPEILPALNPLADNTNAAKMQFPALISLPPGINIPANMVDRTTVLSTSNLLKLVTTLASPNVICWGLIRRPDKKLAFQFLKLRYNYNPNLI